MKYLGQIVDDKDLVNKEYVDDASEVVQTITSGTKIGSVGGTDLYAPSGGGGGSQTTWWGTSDTGPQYSSKVVTCADFSLTVGAMISVYFTNENSTSTPTLNVNSTGAKTIYIGADAGSYTTNRLYWSAGTIVTFVYDGTYWRYLTSVSAASTSPSRGAGSWSGTCSSSAAATTKSVSSTNYVLTKGALISATFTYGNTLDSFKLNVGVTGDKDVYRGNSIVSSSNPLKWSAGDTLTFMYDGTYYRYLSSSSNIGAKNWVAPSSVSCQSGKWYKVAEVELDPGIWFIDCNAYFPKKNTTGTRQIRVTTDTFTDGTTTAPALYGNIGIDVQMGVNEVQYPQAHFPVDISSRTTFRLAAYQGSGSTMSVTGRMYATRLK